MRDRRLATTLPLLPARCQEGMELPTMQRSMFQVLDALGCSPEEGAFVPPWVASGPDPRGEGEESHHSPEGGQRGFKEAGASERGA